MSGSSRSAARSACLNELRVHADLPLRHQALLVRVHELDRVLDRDDVVGARPVDEVDQRGERGALARAGRPRHQDQALGEVAEVLHLAAQAQLVRGVDRRGDEAKHGHRPVAVAPGIAAEPGQPFDLVSPVGVPRVAELADLAGRHDAEEHRLQPLQRQRRLGLAHDFAVPPEQRRLAGAEVEVRGAGLHQQAKKLFDLVARRGHLGGVARGRRAGRRAAAGGPDFDDQAPRARRERHRHLAARRAVRKGEGVRPVQPRGGLRIGHLAHQREDLPIGERILGQRAARAVGEEHRGPADGELQRLGALLVQDLNQAVEPGHRQPQSRGRARRTRDLLKYQLTSSVPSMKKMPVPFR